MYAILTIFAGFTVVMFVATAITSIINAYREGEVSREALSRSRPF